MRQIMTIGTHAMSQLQQLIIGMTEEPNRGRRGNLRTFPLKFLDKIIENFESFQAISNRVVSIFENQ